MAYQKKQYRSGKSRGDGTQPQQRGPHKKDYPGSKETPKRYGLLPY